MRSYNERKYKRFIKGMNRIKRDRAQHGNDHSCECFKTKGQGKEFSRFADNPQLCSGYCCGNQRKVSGPTNQEKRASNVNDWI